MTRSLSLALRALSLPLVALKFLQGRAVLSHEPGASGRPLFIIISVDIRRSACMQMKPPRAVRVVVPTVRAADAAPAAPYSPTPRCKLCLIPTQVLRPLWHEQRLGRCWRWRRLGGARCAATTQRFLPHSAARTLARRIQTPFPALLGVQGCPRGWMTCSSRG